MDIENAIEIQSFIDSKIVEMHPRLNSSHLKHSLNLEQASSSHSQSETNNFICPHIQHFDPIVRVHLEHLGH